MERHELREQLSGILQLRIGAPDQLWQQWRRRRSAVGHGAALVGADAVGVTVNTEQIGRAHV